jgi:hypothetical protein
MSALNMSDPASPVATADPQTVKARHTAYVQNAWIILLLIVIAICAIIVAYNFIQLDLVIHHLQQTLNGTGSGNCFSQGGTDTSC